MKDITKYQGVIPAFYACYDAEGNISTEGVKALTRHLIAKGVKGVYCLLYTSPCCLCSQRNHQTFRSDGVRCLTQKYPSLAGMFEGGACV